MYKNKEDQGRQAAQRRYLESPKGKAMRRKYHNSPEGQAAQKRYKSSPAGKSARLRVTAKPNFLAVNRKCKIMRAYSLTVEEYESILGQGCCICGDEATCMDHCHASGNVRGGLCKACNSGLGMFKDNPQRLAAAMLYLLSSWRQTF